MKTTPLKSMDLKLSEERAIAKKKSFVGGVGLEGSRLQI